MLNGKVALVTGSTSGIGLAVARALARSGAAVMLNGSRPAAEAEDLRASLAAEFGVPVAYTSADLADPASVRALVAATKEQLGGVDILVNNAGIQHVAPVDQFPEEKWDQLIAINLSSVFHATKAVLPGMKARNWGRIVNIASAHGLVASPFKAPYTASKHAVVGLSKAVALEVAETGITCNAVCPGYVRTPLVEKQVAAQAQVHQLPEEQVIRDVILAAQPNKRFLEADDLAAFVLFLCSPAGAGMTGAALPMDGAWTAR
ncbi:3-hydroxybutyrate dehydrogenase [Azospira sp. I13]|uniref:3-hydroxybutyrate dehydrogenase n=1 Tax=Azospira sp. I13 TaxID=1765050 RepID=UPI000D4240E3|nr:3-hydroxybutyrate dehydrogenase [Azospira sp. I13]GBG03489.1 3-hydroxybutyrate dehydrogenase [Azospira sp. I13]